MELAQNIPRGAGAATIAVALEREISAGRLASGTQLPPVRELAETLSVSPATVAAAYRTLRQRGLVTANRRRGTIVATQPPLRTRPRRLLPAGVRDLATGNPDPALLPPLESVLARLDPAPVLYGGAVALPALLDLAEADFAADGIGGKLAIVSGALDGIERVLQTQLRPGDRVVVEDPSWPRIADLVHALGLRPEPARVDERGLIPAELDRALSRDARAVIATPRGQNPTGAAVDPERGSDLREILARYPDALVIEDDYVAAVAGAPYVPLHDPRGRWVVVRSLAKVFGPDLRVAPIAGDPVTIGHVERRQLLGPGWVSHLLQQTVALAWADAGTKRRLALAERTYADRRAALVDAVRAHGIDAFGGSGLGVWVPVVEESAVTAFLLERGWAVSPGERYRFGSPPAIRITTTTLEPTEARELAAAIDEAVNGGNGTYAA